MLVEYNPEVAKPRRISSLQFPGIGSEGFLNINPGNQDVALQDLKAIMANPAYRFAFESRMNDGMIRLRTSAGVILHELKDIEKLEVADSASEPSLEGYSVADAVKIIEETYDVALLKRWRDEDSRKGVEKAIAAQLDVLEPPTKEK